jgi:hypothetical protein
MVCAVVEELTCGFPGRCVRRVAVRVGSAGPWVVVGEAVVGGQVRIGRWSVLAHRVRKPGFHGQCSGRWRCIRRAEVAILAGMLIRFLRIVGPVASAWNRSARVPAARVRLEEIAARVGHAALAWSFPERRWAEGSFFEVGEDLLDHGMAPVVGFCPGDGRAAVGRYGVVAVGGERLALALGPGRVRAFHAPCDQARGDLQGFGFGGERGVADLGDLGLGDPALLVLVPGSVPVLDRFPCVFGDPSGSDPRTRPRHARRHEKTAPERCLSSMVRLDPRQAHSSRSQGVFRHQGWTTPVLRP